MKHSKELVSVDNNILIHKQYFRPNKDENQKPKLWYCGFCDFAHINYSRVERHIRKHINEVWNG